MLFTPVVRTATSVPKTLLEFSKERKINIQLIDFELISFETLTKHDSDTEYEIIEDTKNISDEDLLNDELDIRQEYSIKIFPKEKSKPQDLKLSCGVNKLKTKAVITIPKGTLLARTNQQLKELRDAIWKQKLRAGLYIDFFEPKLLAQLKKLLTSIKPNTPLSKDVKFSIAEGINPQPPVDAKLEKIYEEKESDSVIDGVEVGELIARYHKEKRGKDGRACNGKYITIRAPRVLNLRPVLNEKVIAKETEESIDYFANDNGYVVYDKGMLTISQQLKLNKADFKSTANIDAGGNDRDISVTISHKKSHSEDAIGSGVKIDVKELDVNGSVAANVKINTQELNVDAQTHRDSKMEVQNNANIKLHRGDLSATNAEINILETGKVTARESIHIKKMLGGEACAPVVIVDELLSNSIIIASERIEILSINGDNNELIINPDAVESYHTDIEKLKEKIAQAQKAYKVKIEAIEQKLQEHASQLERMQTFQKRVIQAKKSGKTPMKQDILRVQKYKRDAEKLTQDREATKIDKEAIIKLEEELDKLLNADLQAFILSKTSYNGHTKVIFINPKTKEELSAYPEGRHEKISLTLDADGERIIEY